MERIQLPFGGSVTVVRNYIETDDDLLQHLTDSVPWTVGIYNYGGHSVATPRLLWAMRDHNYRLSHAYTVTGSSEWTEPVASVRDKICKDFGIYARYAQLNMYRSGADSISWHSDREVQPSDHIVSLSLGATRSFQFRPKHPVGRRLKSDTITIQLEHNTLVIMDQKAASTHYQHQIPKMSNEFNHSRISITFRER